MEVSFRHPRGEVKEGLGCADQLGGKLLVECHPLDGIYSQRTERAHPKGGHRKNGSTRNSSRVVGPLGILTSKWKLSASGVVLESPAGK